MIRLFRRYAHILLTFISILLLTGCHSSKKGKVSEFKEDSGVLQTRVGNGYSSLSRDQKMIVDEAYTWLGTPYAYAHAEKGIATDCSGMVLRVYETVLGVKLPRNSEKQAQFCKDIKRKEIKTGDLVFFATGKDPHKISHVGIMLDEDNFIHASSSKGVVVSSISQPYYVRTFIQFGRIP